LIVLDALVPSAPGFLSLAAAWVAVPADPIGRVSNQNISLKPSINLKAVAVVQRH
jgi:hypothetical protein